MGTSRSRSRARTHRRRWMAPHPRRIPACWLARWALLAALAKAAPGSRAHAQEPEVTAPAARRALDSAYKLKAQGEREQAHAAFLAAREAGAQPQRIALELAYLAIDRGDLRAAQAELERALLGPDASKVTQAKQQLRAMGIGSAAARGARDNSTASPRARSWMEYAYRRKEAGDLDEAESAVRAAVGAGANPQLASLELGFIAMLRKRPRAAQTEFRSAARGPNPELAREARRQLRAITPATTASSAETGPERLQVASVAVAHLPRTSAARAYLARGNRFRIAGKLSAARAAFEIAKAQGADAQRIDLQLGHLAADNGEPRAARVAFTRAAAGANPHLAEEARRHLGANAGPRVVAALEEAYRLETEREFEAATRVLDYARREGVNAQLVELERGYIERSGRAYARARTAFDRAARGADAFLADEARTALEALRMSDPSYRQLEIAYGFKASRNPAAAISVFEEARKAGADPQLVDLEIGYLASDSGQPEQARAAFLRASQGPDTAMAAEASSRLKVSADVDLSAAPSMRFPAPPQPAATDAPDSPTMVWGDLYVEAFGWKRIFGPDRNVNLVPTLRARMLLRPWSELDLHGYLVGEVTRDLASRGADRGGTPIIYSDNKLLIGAGVLLRLWGGRVGVFAQLGRSLDLVRSDARVETDGRVGAYLGLETDTCWTAPGGVALHFSPCAEGYAELTYLSRFDHDVVGFARARGGLGLAVTGPLQWSLVLEVRSGKDSNGDYYNNFADVGLGVGLRLLEPLRVDLMLAGHTGSYFGDSNVDPPPANPGYTDLRLQVATYAEF